MKYYTEKQVLSFAQQIASAVQDGVPITSAVKLVGLTRRTHYDWLQRAEEGQEPYATYAAIIEQAQAKAIAAAISAIRARWNQDWKAAAWFLERCFPDQFARRMIPDADEKVIEIHWVGDEGDG
ncbi:MAG: helix-turn-helix domain-containing protein [Bacteroidota bacterium]|nr:helix-turn-helix domain containing protein [Candidatus Kapabacteria bacterium]MDW8226160.1 helix-turn-helix domain-containing protein [Bacteroidota bacterium]